MMKFVNHFVMAGLLMASGVGAALAAPDNIRLLYAQPFNYAAAGMTWNNAYLYVHAKNIGAETSRHVYIHYNDGTPAWQDVEMQLVGNYGDHSTYQYTFPAAKVEFVIKYQTSVGVFWDNNEGANYKVQPWIEQGDYRNGVVGYNVGLVTAAVAAPADRGSGTINYVLSGDIAVQNTTYHKVVGIRVNVDGGWRDLRASYAYTMSTGGANRIEIWRFNETVKRISISTPAPPIPTFRFAVFYQENPAAGGRAYWDNNFQQDYYLTNAQRTIK